MRNVVDIVGDGIENPHNARAMINIARMFGASCYFRDRKKLDVSVSQEIKDLQFVSIDDLSKTYKNIVALENVDRAADIYGFQLPLNVRAALLTGNERFGISHEMLKTAKHVVQIPMPGADLNTINVAAASAVALYYLSRGAGSKMQIKSDPAKRRPDLLFMGVGDHIELGSAIRSAAAFGLNRLFVEDRENVWFDCDRILKSEGRGAARRGRNSIRLVPVQKENKYSFQDVVVFSTTQGTPIHKANLSGGQQQLLVIADESKLDLATEDWERLGKKIQYARIELPVSDYTYHFRALASIALAEASRQVGQKSEARVRHAKQGPVYESSLKILLEQIGEEVSLDELSEY